MGRCEKWPAVIWGWSSVMCVKHVSMSCAEWFSVKLSMIIRDLDNGYMWDQGHLRRRDWFYVNGEWAIVQSGVEGDFMWISRNDMTVTILRHIEIEWLSLMLRMIYTGVECDHFGFGDWSLMWRHPTLAPQLSTIMVVVVFLVCGTNNGCGTILNCLCDFSVWARGWVN